MRPVSTADVEKFCPDRYGGRDDAPRYHLSVLSVRERLWIDMETLERCGKGVSSEEFLDAIRAGVLAVLDGEEQTKALAVLSGYEEADEAWRDAEKSVPSGTVNGNVPIEVREARVAHEAALTRVGRLEDVVSRSYRPLARLLRVNLERAGEMAVLYVQCGVRGWDNLAGPCTRAHGRLADEAVNVIPLDDLAAIAVEVRRLCELSEADRGNSASPSGVSATPVPPSAV